MDKATRDQLTIARFEAGDIDPELFTHEAHVFVGWQYINAFKRKAAIAHFDAALRRLTVKLGATDKYNAMITWLFLLLIAERARKGEDWSAFRARNADLFEERPTSKAA